MIGCGIFIFCGFIKNNKNIGWDEYMYGLEFLEFYCYRIFLISI